MTKKLIIGIGVLLLAGVATLLVSGRVSWLDGLRSEDARLRDRLETYWQARQAGDLETMALSAHPLQPTRSPSRMLITDAYEIQDLQIDGDEAIATVRFQAHLSHPKLAKRKRDKVLKSRWVLYEGNWFRGIGPTDFKGLLKGAQMQLHPEMSQNEAPGASRNGEEEAGIQEDP